MTWKRNCMEKINNRKKKLKICDKSGKGAKDLRVEMKMRAHRIRSWAQILERKEISLMSNVRLILPDSLKLLFPKIFSEIYLFFWRVLITQWARLEDHKCLEDGAVPSCLLIQDLAIGIISQCEQFLVYTLLHLFCHVLLSILQVPFSQKICTLTPSISYSIRQYKTVAKTSLKIFQSFFYLNMDAKTQFIARL